MNAFDIISEYGSLKRMPINKLEHVYNFLPKTTMFSLSIQNEVIYRLENGDREESKIKWEDIGK
jgi:hypothetical protein